MKSIKTKEVAQVKVLDRASNLHDRAKNSFVKTKGFTEKAVNETKQSKYSSPDEYATDKVQGTVKSTVYDTVHVAKDTPQNVRENVAKVNNAVNKAKAFNNNQQVKQVPHGRVPHRQAPYSYKATTNAKNSLNPRHTYKAYRHTDTAPNSSGRSATRLSPTSEHKSTIKTNLAPKAIKHSQKGQVKSARKSIKSVGVSATKNIKTTERSAKTAYATAKASRKTAIRAQQTARAASQTAAKATKRAVIATIKLVRLISAAIKSLITAIVSGIGVAILIIVTICMIAIFIGSAFGIFFANETSFESTQTINSVISEIDSEFTAHIDFIINSNQHDSPVVSGSRALWKYVLAVYTVLTATDPDNPMDVVTMDAQKALTLRHVFWTMNSITYELVEYEDEVDVLDEDGEPTGETEIEATVTLYITINSMSINEMSAYYSFNDEQNTLLSELLKPEYDILWNTLLFGVGSLGSGTIVEIAASQIGNIGGEIYWRWYGFNSRVAWCAIFVSWVAEQAGYLETGTIPRFAAVVSGVEWFQTRGQWGDKSYTPSPGDLIFFAWQVGGRPNHVGIVERVEGGYVHTIEGNSSNSVRRRSYRLDSVSIIGYGVLLYQR